MVSEDLRYIKKLLLQGIVSSPCLELGVAYGGDTCKELITGYGIEYFGTDMKPGVNVDFVANFEDSSEILDLTFNQKFSTILVLNVLEHTFDPIRILDNIIHLLSYNGKCIFITPAIWPLHDYPYDCWRINPNFYEEYCSRRSLKLLDEHFEYIGYGKVRDFVNNKSTYEYPKPYNVKKRIKSFTDRAIQKMFNTYGRSMFFPSHLCVGGVIQKT